MDKEYRTEILTLTSEVRLSDKTLFFNRSLVHSSARDQFRNYHQFGFISEDTSLWVQKLPYFFKFAGFPQIFRQCLYLWRLFLEYLVLSGTLFPIEIPRGEDPTTGEDLFLGEVSFFREVSSRASWGTSTRNRLPLRRKLRGIRTSGGSMLESVPQSEV